MKCTLSSNNLFLSENSVEFDAWTNCDYCEGVGFINEFCENWDFQQVGKGGLCPYMWDADDIDMIQCDCTYKCHLIPYLT